MDIRRKWRFDGYNSHGQERWKYKSFLLNHYGVVYEFKDKVHWAIYFNDGKGIFDEGYASSIETAKIKVEERIKGI